MDEHLDLHGTAAADVRDLLTRKLAREHDAADAELRRLLHALERVNAHLRGGVDRHLRRDLAAERHHAEILHDECVHAEHRSGADDVGGTRHFAVGDERVECQMHLDAAHVAVDNGLLQLVHGKVLRAHAGVERIISKINRVGAILNGGAERLHRAGGRQ